MFEAPQPSLIRQRQDIHGRKSIAIGGVVLSSGWVLLLVARLVWFIDDTTSLLTVLGWGACGVALLTIWVFRLRKVLTQERAFDAEHGEGAGRQESITRQKRPR